MAHENRENVANALSVRDSVAEVLREKSTDSGYGQRSKIARKAAVDIAEHLLQLRLIDLDALSEHLAEALGEPDLGPFDE